MQLIPSLEVNFKREVCARGSIDEARLLLLKTSSRRVDPRKEKLATKLSKMPGTVPHDSHPGPNPVLSCLEVVSSGPTAA